MTKEDFYAGEWLINLLKSIINLKEEDRFKIIYAYQEALKQLDDAKSNEEAELELATHKIREDLKKWDEDKASMYRDAGWSISRRAVKTIDTQRFLEEHGGSVPSEALKIVQSKLPSNLVKEIKKYEQITKHTVTVKKR